MDPVTALPLLDPVFSLEEARQAGLTDHELHGPRLTAPSRGLRMWAGTEPGWVDLARALCQLDGDHCLSHVTAAQLWGIWLPIWLQDGEQVHVTGQKGFSGSMRRPGVVGHRAKLDTSDVVAVDGLRLTSPARTWLDLAPLLKDPLDLVAAGDALLQRSDGPPRPDGVLGANPLATLTEIDAAMRRRRSVKGIQAAREARPMLREGVDSAPESRMRMVVVSAGLPEPVVNPVIMLAPGVRRQPDLALLEWKLALQYDGGGHAEQAQVNRDIWRDDDFDRHDWRTVRAGRDLYTAHGEWAFLERVRRAMREQEQRGFGPHR
ncbi:hypothetical protein [Micrococcus terreus]|uniref:hypothetical protein n=1 Tax=Micrococcus terreus TaxID=574650 RepID=UPI002550336C|nr:hypothetical protein [Micrococcus terreus]MDK7702270.1 hypothetical protein [Micrococcus terreus]WOO98838.1 hypothetical protein R3I42_06945 [Micrococcus terreus]